ncbi:hypothetical protein N9544_06035 [Flavobacteriales bacterium]|nr:hypothetical protein [Flavobacteriales bacterium]
MTTTCSVCNNQVSGNYCSNCGQQITKKTTRFLSLILDFIGNFFSVDKSFIGTSKKLLSDPKFIVNNFHEGNRRYYLSPGSFIIYGITIIAIHTIFFGSEIWGIEFMVGGIPLQYALLILLLPFLIFSSYVTFIRQGYHISKHIISISYIATIFLSIFLILDDIMVSLISEDYGNLIMLFFLIFTFVWNSMVFSTKKNVWYHILNALVQLIIFAGLFFLIFIIFQSDKTAIN